MVRLDNKAFNDPRIKLLGKLCGKDWVWGLGAMAIIWRHCTEEQAYSMPIAIADALLQDGFAKAMVEAGLAAELSPLEIRIRGTSGRIEWLEERRVAAAKGGAKTKAKWQAKTGNSPGALSLSLSPTSINTSRDSQAGSEDGTAVSTVISHLNKLTGCHYRNSDATAKYIRGRLGDGYEVKDLLDVIDLKCKEWLGTEMAKYLRPATLFGPEKFPSYLAASQMTKAKVQQVRPPEVTSVEMATPEEREQSMRFAKELAARFGMAHA